MKIKFLDHGLPDNPYNKHAWVLGKPEIGERVWVGSFCVIDALHAPLKIGRGTDISSGAQIITHSTLNRCLSEHRYGFVQSAPTEIGEFCFIGTNAVILMGARIGHHSVVAAGAVVRQGMVVPPYSIVAGIPAKIIGSSKKFLKDIERESVSVVIPAYNEQKTVERVAREALGGLKKVVQDYELVLIDDGSTDNTPKIIDSLAKRNKKIRAVHHKTNRGFTGAMRTAFASAKKNTVFLAPADGQFDFGELGKFVEGIKGYHVVLGYRIYNEEPVSRKLNSFLFHLLSKMLFGIGFKEISTVSMWRRQVLQSIEIESDDRSAMMLPELTHKAIKKRYKFNQVPIHWYLRKGGKAKGAGFTTIYKTLLEMGKLWWRLESAS